MLKSKLRRRILKKRKLKYNHNTKIQINKILRHIDFKVNKKIIGGYFPVNYEIDCLDILQELEKKKWQIALPRIKKNNLMDFCKFSFTDPLKLNKYGIPEPISKKILYPDYILVPLVAFDKNLNRLGYGGGYYDRYIEKINNRKKITTIGLAFSYQEINKVPIQIFDRKLSMIFTEKNIYK